MSTTLIGLAGFRLDDAGNPEYHGEVLLSVGQAGATKSSVTVSLGAGDTLATLQTKFLAAIDAEASRLGLPAQTDVYGGAVAKFR